jgi:hypothetical protein
VKESCHTPTLETLALVRRQTHPVFDLMYVICLYPDRELSLIPRLTIATNVEAFGLSQKVHELQFYIRFTYRLNINCA